MENELVMTSEDSYIVEESSSQCESESDSMNVTEDSDSDTEFDVNNSSYNVAIQPANLICQMLTLFLGLKWWKKKMDTLKLILIQQLVAPNI